MLHGSTFIVTHGETIFCLEQARKGSSKLIASSMPTNEPIADRRVPIRKVPLHIRRAAREAFNI